MSEAGSSSRSVSPIWTITPLVFLLIIAVLVLYGSFTVIQTQISDPSLKVYLIIVAIVVEAVDIHIFVSALTKISELGIHARETYSFGLHLCNCDRRHCYKIRGKTLPLCARHLGYYGTAWVLGVTVLLFPSTWSILVRSLQPNFYLVIAVALTTFVSVEGGLGKRGIIHQSKNLRFLNGVLTVLAYVALTMALIGFFSLV